MPSSKVGKWWEILGFAQKSFGNVSPREREGALVVCMKMP
jgi:hypothetical protein